jgi:hypothetical protein
MSERKPTGKVHLRLPTQATDGSPGRSQTEAAPKSELLRSAAF